MIKIQENKMAHKKTAMDLDFVIPGLKKSGTFNSSELAQPA